MGGDAVDRGMAATVGGLDLGQVRVVRERLFPKDLCPLVGMLSYP